MKRRMGRKGFHFLNLSEDLVLGICIFLGFIILSLATNLALDRAQQQTAELEGEYHTTQLLRTYAQTAITIEETTTTVAAALNRYFELSSKPDTTDIEDQDRRAIEQSLKEHAFTYLRPFIGDATKKVVNTYAVKNGQELSSLELLEIKSNVNSHPGKPKYCPQYIQLPAYFAHEVSRPGSYHIIIELTDEGEQGRQADRTGVDLVDC